MTLVPDHHTAYEAAIDDDLEKMVKMLGYFLYRNSPTYEYDNAALVDAENEAAEMLAQSMLGERDNTSVKGPA